MKLAFCLFRYFPFGGLQRDFVRIARLCQERGHEIHIYTMAWEGEVHSQFNLHLIQPEGWQNHTQIRSFSDQVARELAKEAYDLVIGFNKMPNLDLYYAADVCYQARVHSQRGLFYRLLPRYKRLVAQEKAVFAQGQSTAIMLISALQQPEFMRYYHTEKERFHLLPPGIAKDRVAPANAAEIRAKVRKTHQLSEDDQLLLMVGSGFKTKGLDRSIRGLAALPASLKARCHLVVIGQDHAKPFQQLAQQLKVADRILFLGGRSDVPDYLLAADLLLHPAYHENTGTVLLEAVVSGLPVLTVENCGYAHYIQEANAGAVLSVPFEQADFNTQLEKMLLSPERKSWQQNGLAFAKTADIYSLPERAADLIEQMGKKRDTVSA